MYGMTVSALFIKNVTFFFRTEKTCLTCNRYFTKFFRVIHATRKRAGKYVFTASNEYGQGLPFLYKIYWEVLVYSQVPILSCISSILQVNK